MPTATAVELAEFEASLSEASESEPSEVSEASEASQASVIDTPPAEAAAEVEGSVDSELLDEDDLRAAEDAVAAEEARYGSDGSEDPELVMDDPDRDGWTLVQSPTMGEWPGYEVISPESE